MDIINIMNNNRYLDEYIRLCNKEWGSIKSKEELDKYIFEKRNIIVNEDKVISILGLIDEDTLVGFISLFKYDGDYRRDLTPWYATMYVKEEYRNKGYSKMLNNAVIEEAKELGYKKMYLKTELVNYYEKFGFKYMEMLNDSEKLYYLDIED